MWLTLFIFSTGRYVHVVYIAELENSRDWLLFVGLRCNWAVGRWAFGVSYGACIARLRSAGG